MSAAAPELPTDEQVRLFHQQGYLPRLRVTGASDLGRVRDLCDRVYPARQSDGAPAKSLITVTTPEGRQPDLRETALAGNARTIFARLFEVAPDRVLVGWRLFVKPGLAGGTPWHQDGAYRVPPFNGGTLWVPIDPIAQDGSWLRFLPGTQRDGLRPHAWHGDHKVTDVPDDTAAVVCPLGPGEATAHHCLILHAATPNPAPTPRRAVALVCQLTGP